MDDITLAFLVFGIEHPEAIAQVKVLTEANALEAGERRNQRAMTMSGGEQQMLAIARALMSRPKLLLLDEPSLGLAPIVVKQIFSTLRELAKSGMTIFLVEQNANHALRLSDRAYVMVTGEIRMTGTGEELLGNQEVREAYLGGH